MSLVLRDPQAVQQCFMPGIKNGGILIETDKLYPMGAEILLLLSLPDSQQRIPITGKVIWVRPHSRDGQPSAIGIQIQNDRTGVLGRIHQIISEAAPYSGEIPAF